MHLERYAYYCDRGTQDDRCFDPIEPIPDDGWERARVDFGHKRLVAWASRSAVLATAAARKCVDGCDEKARRELPMIVACATGVGMSAHFVRALTEATEEHRSLEALVFSMEGPSVHDSYRYSSTMLAGTVALLTGVKGENRTVSGTRSALLALRQAERYLRSGRAPRCLVVFAESLLEYTAAAELPEKPNRILEFGCAMLLSQRSDGPKVRLSVGAQSAGLSPARFPHFEAANAAATMCWSLEQEPTRSRMFQDKDAQGRCWQFGFESPLADGGR